MYLEIIKSLVIIWLAYSFSTTVLFDSSRSAESAPEKILAIIIVIPILTVLFIRSITVYKKRRLEFSEKGILFEIYRSVFFLSALIAVAVLSSVVIILGLLFLGLAGVFG